MVAQAILTACTAQQQCAQCTSCRCTCHTNIAMHCHERKRHSTLKRHASAPVHSLNMAPSPDDPGYHVVEVQLLKLLKMVLVEVRALLGLHVLGLEQLLTASAKAPAAVDHRAAFPCCWTR